MDFLSVGLYCVLYVKNSSSESLCTKQSLCVVCFWVDLFTKLYGRELSNFRQFFPQKERGSWLRRMRPDSGSKQESVMSSRLTVVTQ